MDPGPRYSKCRTRVYFLLQLDPTYKVKTNALSIKLSFATGGNSVLYYAHQTEMTHRLIDGRRDGDSGRPYSTVYIPLSIRTRRLAVTRSIVYNVATRRQQLSVMNMYMTYFFCSSEPGLGQSSDRAEGDRTEERTLYPASWLSRYNDASYTNRESIIHTLKDK